MSLLSQERQVGGLMRRLEEREEEGKEIKSRKSEYVVSSEEILIRTVAFNVTVLKNMRMI